MIIGYLHLKNMHKTNVRKKSFLLVKIYNLSNLYNKFKRMDCIKLTEKKFV